MVSNLQGLKVTSCAGGLMNSGVSASHLLKIMLFLVPFPTVGLPAVLGIVEERSTCRLRGCKWCGLCLGSAHATVSIGGRS